MTAEWWYLEDKERKGPFTEESIARLIKEGEICGSTLAWSAGMQSWERIETLSQFNSMLSNVPPPIPGRRRAYLKRGKSSGELEMYISDPWRRFSARLVDFVFLIVPVSFIIGFFIELFASWINHWLYSPAGLVYGGIIFLPAVLLTEALIFSLFGNTPGKKLFGLSIKTAEGTQITGSDYARRQIGVYIFGLGLGIPVVNLISMGLQFVRLKTFRPTLYDKGKYEVFALPLSGLRSTVAAGILVASILGYFWLTMLDQQYVNEMQRPSVWTNDITGNIANIPAGWQAYETLTEGDQISYEFNHIYSEKYVMLSYERLYEEFLLKNYVTRWVGSLGTDFQFGESSTVNGYSNVSAQQMAGFVTGESNEILLVRFYRIDSIVWTIIHVAGDLPDSSSDFYDLEKSIISTL